MTIAGLVLASNSMVEVFPNLLQLPAELHHLIIEHLPLSASIIYQTQVCSTLRSLFGARMKLSCPYRFDLVEWSTAEKEIRELLRRQGDGKCDDAAKGNEKKATHKARKSIWDTSPSSTPRPAPAKSTAINASHLSPLLMAASPQLRQHGNLGDEEDLLLLGNHPEMAFLVRCMRMLGRIKDGSKVHEGQDEREVDSFLALSLLSPSGFKVAPLIHLLETQPNLRHVEAILMTSASFVDSSEFENGSHLLFFIRV